MRPGDHQPRCAEDALRVVVLTQAQSPPLCLGPPWGWKGASSQQAFSSMTWLQTPGPPSRGLSHPSGGRSSEGTRCQGHPDTCQEHKHGSCEAAWRCQGHLLCLAVHLLAAFPSGQSSAGQGCVLYLDGSWSLIHLALRVTAAFQNSE